MAVRDLAQPRASEVRASLPNVALAVLIGLWGAKFLLHLFTVLRHYGYFRDELYYLDMARHLDWG